jgi:signal transduction histidine kinase
VRDLLPEASLKSLSSDVAQTDATALVTLPVKLLTGKVPIIQLDASSPLKPALAIAWACLIAAALAIAFVLHRAVLLSERRGAFVSAVTHELRTPLTTFRLYSEMLADDMVPDPERRREYLTTLCDESTRLMHLVENVLSFSRIERGRTAARLEMVNVQNLIQRTEPRLRQRTDQVGLVLKTDLNHEAGLACVKVDALAVEQILFNLTDNACKYAAPDSAPHELHLSVVAEGNDIHFSLRDYGPGLSKQARKKLFQPFAKSATEAAHSAPGVGLGLALCRRLARELGGSLKHQAASGRGACFCLSLPRQA